MSTIHPSLTDEINKRTNYRLLPVYLMLVILTISIAIVFLMVMAEHHPTDKAAAFRVANGFKYLALAGVVLAFQGDAILGGLLAYAYKKYRARGAQE